MYGRPLMNLGKSNKNMEADKTNEVEPRSSLANAIPTAPPPPPSDQQAVIGASQPPPPPAGHDINNFRPTVPGHSPGVGHSIQN